MAETKMKANKTKATLDFTLPNQQLIQLAQKYGTPLYIYTGDLVEQRYKELLSYFPYKKTKLFYAMKANYNLAILKLLEQAGANIDAVSPGDILLALKAGFSKKRILFTANMMTDEEIHQVQQLGILFNIGSLSELERYGKFYPRNKVCIRFNPDIVSGFHENVRTGGKDTKFGIFLHHLENVKRIAKKYDLTIVGIHEHTGSGIPETVDMMAGFKNILNIIKKEHFPELKFVDFGGGFKVPYKPEEKMIDYVSFGKIAIKMFRKVCQEFGKELGIYFEPGRYLVAESGFLLVRVTVVKENGRKNIAGTDSGFPQLIRPMFYDAYHHILNLSNPSGAKKKYDVAGNICETGDYFAVNRELPEIREGDILAVQNAGAYCYSMGGVYNLRPMPAEVLVLNGKDKLVRKRLFSKELVELIVKESI